MQRHIEVVAWLPEIRSCVSILLGKKVKKRNTWREKIKWNTVTEKSRGTWTRQGENPEEYGKEVEVTYRTGKGARTLWEEKKDGRKNRFAHDFSPK